MLMVAALAPKERTNAAQMMIGQGIALLYAVIVKQK